MDDVDRAASIAPPEQVLLAFGATEAPAQLAGGQGQTFRSGAIVLKPVPDDAVTAWLSEVMSTVDGEGFRVPRPLRATTGAWVCDGWAAWRFVDGAPQQGNWSREIETCVRFHEAIATVPRPDCLDDLVSPWAVADRVSWGELELELDPRIEPHVDRLRDRLRPIAAADQLVHGDFGGSNLLFHPDLPPAVLDMSPYWRPAGLAVGVLVADAIVWEGAHTDLCREAEGIADFPQLLARAELRRIVELQTIEAMLGWPMLGEIEDHLPLIDHICRYCA